MVIVSSINLGWFAKGPWFRQNVFIVAKLVIVRYVLYMVIGYIWNLYQIDVKYAFWYGGV